MDNENKPVDRRRFLRTGAAGVVSLGLVTAAEAGTHSKSEPVPNSSPAPMAHSELTGLDSDDHPQYFNKTRADLRYPRREEIEAGLDAKVDASQKDLPNGFVGLDAAGRIPTERFADLTSPRNGDALVLRDGVIVNVLNTYRRLDTEFGVVADGVVNNAAAILTALQACRDAQGGALVFPNGVTKINGSNFVDFNLKRGTLRLLGGGNSRIHIAGGASVFTLQNIPLVVVEGLTFVGTPGGGGVYDFTRNVIWFNAVEDAVVRDCRFLGLAVNAPGDVTFAANKWHGIVIGRQTQLLVDNCHFQGNGTANCPNVGVDDWYGLTVRDSQFIDFGYYGSQTLSKTNFVDNHYWIRAINPGGSTQAVFRDKVMIERCSFDEGHVYGIYVGGAQWVELNNVGLNTGIAQSIFLKNVQRATLNDVLVAKANNPGVISVAATDCGTVEINNLLHGAGVTTLQLLGTTERAIMRGCSTPSIFTNTAGATVEQLVAVPASASAAGIKGQYAEDANYRYFCTATDTWKRTELLTW